MNELDVVAERLGPNVGRNAPSAPLTTYRCGGPIAVLVRIEREADVVAAAAVLQSVPHVEVLTIGRGSNLLIADAGFEGVALLLGGELERMAVDTRDARVDAGAAVALPVLARRAAAAGVGDLEFYVGIPGSVGGAVRMNAGGHGADTRAVVIDTRIVDLDTGTVRTVERDALGLGYRHAALGARDVVVGARFRGRPADAGACNAQIDEIVRWRREHQPGGQNAGSVFVNPSGDAAGRLIDAAGCKGLRIGGAEVSTKHANFFVADSGARADDVYALIREVQRRVEETFGVHLHPELRLVGFAGRSEEVAQ
jgi:UDP-N-acetylmuramate dehydrogenase